MVTIDTMISKLTEGFSGTLGLWALSLENGEEIAYNADDSFHPASTIKLAVLYEAFRQAEIGEFDLQSLITPSPADLVGGAGVLKDLEPTYSLSGLNLATLMITISDNTATNLLIDRLGIAKINVTMSALGLNRIRLENQLMRPRPDGPYSRATPRQLGRLMEMIAIGHSPTPTAAEAMLGILKRQQKLDYLTRALPTEEVARLTIAAKGGEIQGTRNMIAAVWREGRGYIISIMSAGCADLRYHPDNEGAVLLARVAQAVHRSFLPA